MPFFAKFSAKKTPPRKFVLAENSKNIERDYNFLEDDNVIRLCLGDREHVFEDGNWISEPGMEGSSTKVSRKLKKQLQCVKEEKNLLQLKFDMVLDMLTESRSQNMILQEKIDKIKGKIRDNVKIKHKGDNH